MVYLLTESPDGSGRRRRDYWRDRNSWRQRNSRGRRHYCSLPGNGWSPSQSRTARSNDGGDAHPDRTQVFFHFTELADAFDDFIKLSVGRLHNPIFSACNPRFAENAAEFGSNLINRLKVRALLDARP